MKKFINETMYEIVLYFENELKLQDEIFVEVLNPYLDKLFYKLISTKSDIYSNVGFILESFYGFEKGYLEL